MRILSVPDQVCRTHALEFWTGLLGYAGGRSTACVKLERLCCCPDCKQSSMSQLKAVAVTTIGESPQDHESFGLHLAS